MFYVVCSTFEGSTRCWGPGAPLLGVLCSVFASWVYDTGAPWPLYATLNPICIAEQTTCEVEVHYYIP